MLKAFNTLPYPRFAKPPEVADGRLVMLLSGDCADAKETVAGVIERIGDAPIDLGRLAEGRRMQRAAGPPTALDLRAALEPHHNSGHSPRQVEPPGGVFTEPDDHGVGRSRGGLTTKLRLTVEQAQP